MPTTRTKTKRREATLRNRYARPHSSTRPAKHVELSQVIERPEDYDRIAMAHFRGESPAPDMIKVWELTYRCIRADGQADEEVDIRRLIAVDRAHAIQGLQEWLAGFGVRTILLYHISPPLTLAEIAALKEINEKRPWEEPRSGTAGADGEPFR